MEKQCLKLVTANDPELQKNAKKAEKWIENADVVDYEVHQVDVNNTSGKAGKPNITNW